MVSSEQNHVHPFNQWDIFCRGSFMDQDCITRCGRNTSPGARSHDGPNHKAHLIFTYTAGNRVVAVGPARSCGGGRVRDGQQAIGSQADHVLSRLA
jgi:hypothetical protein